MIAEFAKYLSECPYMEEEKVKVNYLSERPGAFSLEKAGEKTDKKRYADGGVACSERFILALRSEYGKANSINLETAKKCSDIEKWIEEQNESGNLPVLNDKSTVVSVEVIRGFRPVSANGTSARYEAVVEVDFYKD